MTENFTDLTKQIEKRKLAVIQALQDEQTAIEQMQNKLVLTYTESVQSVASGLINSIRQEENEQLKMLTKSVLNTKKSQIKTRKQLLILIPGALTLGIIIGILATLLITK